MVALRELSGKLFFKEGSVNHQRLTLLVDILNAMVFFKSEREIHIHSVHLQHAIVNIFQTSDKSTSTLTGSASEGMCGGLHDNKIMISYSHIDISSNTLYVQKMLTTIHC